MANKGFVLANASIDEESFLVVSFLALKRAGLSFEIVVLSCFTTALFSVFGCLAAKMLFTFYCLNKYVFNCFNYYFTLYIYPKKH